MSDVELEDMLSFVEIQEMDMLSFVKTDYIEALFSTANIEFFDIMSIASSSSHYN